MAPTFKLPKTLAVAAKEGNQGISNFFSAKRKPGRPKKITMETPEETEQATASALEAHGRPRKEQQPPSSSGKKRKYRPPASEDASLQIKQSRVNWSIGDNRAKLEAALVKWKEEAFDENGEALSMTVFAKMQGIPKRTFSKYASGKLKVGACVGPGRKSVVSYDASSSLVNPIVRYNPHPASKDGAPKVKQIEPALLRWKEKGLDENGEAPSMLAFANIEGIPERTFRKYASGKQEVGASVGRKRTSFFPSMQLEPEDPNSRQRVVSKDPTIFACRRNV
jgi:hypothetical protein